MKDDFIIKTLGMVSRSIDELSSNFTKCGINIRRELKKVILSKGGAWVSILFLFNENNKEKIMLSNFKNMDGLYKRYNYFIIKDKEQARKIYNIIGRWLEE